MIKYEFPCYPGDSVWYVERVGTKYWVRPDVVEMVGFTTRSIRIKLRAHKDFGKTYTWGKNVFSSEAAARDAAEKLTEKENLK